MGGLFLLGGFGLVLVLALPLVLFVGLLVVLTIRHEDDPDADRAPAIYGAVLAFIAVLTLLLSAASVAGSLAELTKDDDAGRYSMMSGDSFSSDGPMSDLVQRRMSGATDSDHDDDWNAIVVSLIAAGVAGAVLWLHRPLLARRAAATGAAHRVVRAYLLVMAFTTVLVALGAAAVLVYDVFRLLAPGVSGAGNRADTLRTAAPTAVLLVGGAWLYRWHWQQTGIESPLIRPPAAVPPPGQVTDPGV